MKCKSWLSFLSHHQKWAIPAWHKLCLWEVNMVGHDSLITIQHNILTGSKMRWYFPNLSMIHASCCGTNKMTVFIGSDDRRRACWRAINDARWNVKQKYTNGLFHWIWSRIWDWKNFGLRFVSKAQYLFISISSILCSSGRLHSLPVLRIY